MGPKKVASPNSSRAFSQPDNLPAGVSAGLPEKPIPPARAGRIAEAMPLYHWFMPLLHLDARPDLVQCIKLCEQIAGRGSFVTRPPRLPLEGADKAEVERLMRTALATRPMLAAA